MKRRLIIFAWILTAGAAAVPVAAQQPGRLTLAAALDRAERQNLDLTAARAQRGVALAGVRIARQIPNPTANFTALRDTPHEGVFIDQPLEIGPKRKRRIELAQAEGGVTEADITAAERQVRRSVREAYYGLAFARGVTREREDVVKLAERLKEIAQARFDAGDIAQLELTQAELELSRARADAQVSQQLVQIALSQLNALLNEPPSTPWELATELETPPPSLTLDELVARASGSNAELARLAQESKVEERRGALFRAERIPNLGLQFGVDFNSPHDFNYGPRGQISMELPIFYHEQGEIAQSTASLHALEAETAAKRRAIAGRVESAYYDLSAREAQVSLYRQTLVPTTQHLVEMAEESYRAGKANILTVLGAQRDVRQVDREYLDTLLAMQAAFADLEETVGAPLD